MVSEGITNDGLCMSRVYQYKILSFSIKVDSVLCVKCGKWIHGICVGVNILKKFFFLQNVEIFEMR